MNTTIVNTWDWPNTDVSLLPVSPTKISTPFFKTGQMWFCRNAFSVPSPDCLLCWPICTMVIANKTKKEQYAYCLNSNCNEMEKYVRYSGYTNSSRLFGYAIELLTPVYFLHNKCKIKEKEVLVQNKPLKMYCLNRLFMIYRHYIVARFSKYEPIYLDPSFVRGLKRDGIDLDFDLIIP